MTPCDKIISQPGKQILNLENLIKADNEKVLDRHKVTLLHLVDTADKNSIVIFLFLIFNLDR
jgi:hypothetical protein